MAKQPCDALPHQRPAASSIAVASSWEMVVAARRDSRGTAAWKPHRSRIVRPELPRASDRGQPCAPATGIRFVNAGFAPTSGTGRG